MKSFAFTVDPSDPDAFEDTMREKVPGLEVQGPGGGRVGVVQAARRVRGGFELDWAPEVRTPEAFVMCVIPQRPEWWKTVNTLDDWMKRRQEDEHHVGECPCRKEAEFVLLVPVDVEYHGRGGINSGDPDDSLLPGASW